MTTVALSIELKLDIGIVDGTDEIGATLQSQIIKNDGTRGQSGDNSGVYGNGVASRVFACA